MSVHPGVSAAASRVSSAVPSDDWDDDAILDEGPSDEDLDRFSGEGVRCRACGREYSDLLDACPFCGADAATARRWPLLVVLFVGLAIAGAIAFGLM